MNAKRPTKWLAKLPLLALVIAVPAASGLLGNYYLTILNNTIIYFIAALGITLLLGMCGQMSFASVAFMGIAGFLAAQLSKHYGVQTLLAGFIAIAVTGVFAYAVGRVLLHLRGSYFTFATIGLAQIFAGLFMNWKWLSGGPDGTAGIPKLDFGLFQVQGNRQWLYLLALVALGCGLFIERIRRTHLGRAAASVRDNEIVACTMGVDVYKTKVRCFTLAGLLSALAGVLLVYCNSYAVESMFSYNISINYILMVMLGGVNSTVGTLLGSFLMTLLPEFLRGAQEYLRLIYGVGIILLMTFMPMGLAGIAQSLYRRLKRRAQGKRPKGPPKLPAVEGGSADA